jgi:hypothetical protein
VTAARRKDERSKPKKIRRQGKLLRYDTILDYFVRAFASLDGRRVFVFLSVNRINSTQ